MDKLFALLGREAAVEGDVGIEIECEGVSIKPLKNVTWKSEDDGSLRGYYPETRAEFVMNGPVKFEDVEKALDKLIKSQAGATFNFSFRTSVHVHLNVQGLTFPQLTALVYTYLLLEEPLINYCGEGRKANRFCLRLADAEGLMEEVIKAVQGEDQLLRIGRDSIRYASLNLEAFKKYGSVEFRGMRGNMDKNILLPWVGMIKCLRDYAETKDGAFEVHEEFRKIGAEKFLNKVMGEYSKLLIDGQTYHNINTSYSLSMDLPYAYKKGREAAKVVIPKPRKVLDGRIVDDLPVPDDFDYLEHDVGPVGSGVFSFYESPPENVTDDVDFWIQEGEDDKADQFRDNWRRKKIQEILRKQLEDNDL